MSTINGVAASGGVTVDASSPLAIVGGAALVESSAGNFLVSRMAQDVFTTLTAVCTHEGCTVNGFQNATYVCPCHGSRFSTAGSVVQGPATRPLQAFASAFASGVLTISTA